jgi:hypothetical protein
VQVPGGDQLRADGRGDGERVVLRRAVVAGPLEVPGGVEVDHPERGLRHPAAAAQRVPVRRRGDRRVGDVQPHHRDRDAAGEHPRGGVRVEPDVELGGRRGVAQDPGAAAHEHDPLQPGRRPRRRREQRGHVGQRAQRDQGDRLGGLLDHVGHQLDGGPVVRTARGGVEPDAAHPLLAVHLRGRAGVPPDERRVGAGRDRDVVAVQQVEQPQGVLGGVLQAGVAADRGHPPDVELR